MIDCVGDTLGIEKQTTKPEKLVVYRSETAEYRVWEFIKEEYKRYKPMYNSSKWQSYEGHRPDIMICTDYRRLVLEIDQFQHDVYHCEHRRY